MTSASDPRQRSIVTSARGAPLTTSRSAHVPTATGPWSHAGRLTTTVVGARLQAPSLFPGQYGAVTHMKLQGVGIACIRG